MPACRTAARRRACANKLPAPWLALVARLRREYRMTGAEIAVRLRLARSPVAGHLRRLGPGRLAALEPNGPARRYSRARAGALVYLDVNKLARFRRVGHRSTGDRRHSSERPHASLARQSPTASTIAIAAPAGSRLTPEQPARKPQPGGDGGLDALQEPAIACTKVSS